MKFFYSNGCKPLKASFRQTHYKIFLLNFSRLPKKKTTVCVKRSFFCVNGKRKAAADPSLSETVCDIVLAELLLRIAGDGHDDVGYIQIAALYARDVIQIDDIGAVRGIKFLVPL